MGRLPKSKIRALRNSAQPTLEDFNRELAERKLIEFVKQAWPIVEPTTPFELNWHHEAICDHLEAVTRGEIRDLIINVPPRHTKSLIVSVMWPAWEWISFPSVRWLFSSYAKHLSIRDSVKCRAILQSNWYQKFWATKFQLIGEPKEKLENDKTGFRLATSVEGGSTGEGGDRIVIDDPHNAKKVESDTDRRNVAMWWDLVMATRRNDPKKSSRVVIMQRTNEGDLVGHIKDREDAVHKWDWLVLPAKYEENHPFPCSTHLQFKDPRKKEGTLLWASRFGDKEIKDLERDLGPYAATGQLQQRPSPQGGAIFKRQWFKFYGTVDTITGNYVALPEKFDSVYQSWDMSFKDLKGSDYVSGGVWGVIGADKYLLSRINDHLDFVNTCRAVEAMTQRHPEAAAKYVEDKANGPAVISQLRTKISGLIAVQPEGSKVSRAYAVTPDFEAGNVWFPHRSIAPWVDEYVEELCSFPMGAHDDDVDMTSQAILKSRDSRHKEIPDIVSITRENPWSDSLSSPGDLRMENRGSNGW